MVSPTLQPDPDNNQPVALDPDQAAALEAVKTWHRDSDEQVFRLFGYAGTGKSTITQRIVDELDLDGSVAYASFSGKAADVMRRKGCTDAKTIHSLIYKPQGQAAKQLRELLKHLKRHPEKAAQAAQRVAELKAQVDNPGFALRDDDPLEGISLIVVDEVSMVGADVGRDLLSFGVKLLVLGDPGQLPPPHGAGFFMQGAPDVTLTKVHRAAETHPITRMATAIRNSRDGDRDFGARGEYDEHNGRRGEVSTVEAMGFDQVIVGTHRVRWNTIRALRGPGAPVIPAPGERVMVLVNQRMIGLLNGQQLTVVAVGKVKQSEDMVELTCQDEDGALMKLPVDLRGFIDRKGEDDARRDTLGGSGLIAMTWANAITCHKSQGSQWDKVLVIDEANTFAWVERKKLLGKVPPDQAAAEGYALARRWLYTAVTRAAERITIVDAICATPIVDEVAA